MFREGSMLKTIGSLIDVQKVINEIYQTFLAAIPLGLSVWFLGRFKLVPVTAGSVPIGNKGPQIVRKGAKFRFTTE